MADFLICVGSCFVIENLAASVAGHALRLQLVDLQFKPFDLLLKEVVRVGFELVTFH